jgi:EmrB/QacA subfamily drug resistance transporter
MSDEVKEMRSGLAFWAPLIAASLALFIVVVDSTMMNVAVPTIVKDLNTNVTAVQGVIALYSLVMASLMLVGSKLGAINGVKRIFIIGVLIYGVGTLVAAVSWNITILALGWSLLEGVGAAMVLPLAYALLVTNYDPKEQAIGFGVLGGVSASAAAVGPILGGVLTTFASWRWGFAMEVVIAIAILPFARYIVEKKTAGEGTTLDWTGSLLSIAGLFSLVLGLILAGRYGWWNATRPFTVGDIQFNPFGLSPTPVLVGIGLAFLVAFVHWQMRREKQNQTPLVSMRVLSNGRFLTGVSTNIFQSMVITGLLFILPLYLQSAVGYSAFQSGLAILPFSIATFAVSLGTASWSERFPAKRLIQLGIFLMFLGIMLLYSVISLNITIVEMIIPLGVFGIGMGLLMAHLVNLILSSVYAKDSPEASGVNNAMDQLGNSLGTAVVGSLLMAFFLGNVVDTVLKETRVQVTPQERTQIITHLEDTRETITEEEFQAFLNQLPTNVQQTINELQDYSIITAMEDTLLVISALLFVMFLLATFIPKQERKIPLAERVPDVSTET